MKRILKGIILVLFLIASAASASSLIWEDGFETYTTGSWPSPWIPDANAFDGAQNFVDNAIAYEGSQSLRLFGAIGGCWAALAYRPITVTPPFEIEVAIRNGNEQLYGCHPDRGYIGLREGTSWANPSRPLVYFLGDGSIRSSSNTVLGSYSPLVWYKIRIRYERPSPSGVNLSYWINDVSAGSETLSAIPDENNLTNLDLTVQEGAAWFDSIRIYQDAQQLPGDANGDGVVNVIDARICLQGALGFLTLTLAQQSACDVDHDGDVDLADAQKIAQFVIGQISGFALLGAPALALSAFLISFIKRKTIRKWFGRRIFFILPLLLGVGLLLTSCVSTSPAIFFSSNGFSSDPATR